MSILAHKLNNLNLLEREHFMAISPRKKVEADENSLQTIDVTEINNELQLDEQNQLIIKQEF